MTTDAKIKNRHHKDAKRDDVVGTKREKSNANHTEDGQKTTHTTPASSRTMTVSMWKSAASDALSRANGQTKSNSSESKWMNQVMRSGTIADKVAALTVAVQENPMSSLAMLEQLIAMCSKSNRRESVTAIDAAKELFERALMNKYKTNIKKSASANDGKVYTVAVFDAELASWYFEDQIKRSYALLLRQLEIMTHETVVTYRAKAYEHLRDLMAKVVEENVVVLTLLGDSDKTISSKVIKSLKDLLSEKPYLKTAVADQIIRYITRQKQSERSKFYGFTVLNQILFRKTGDNELATKLIDLYVSVLSEALHADVESESRLLNAVLTGINRALPYTRAKPEDPIPISVVKKMDDLFRLTHVAPFSVAVQALNVLEHLTCSSSDKRLGPVADRYYKALYERMLLNVSLPSASPQFALFFNLIFKAIRRDTHRIRPLAMIHRLLQTALHLPPTFACGALLLVSESLKNKPKLRKYILTAASRNDRDDEALKEAQAEAEQEAKADDDAAANDGDNDDGADEKQDDDEGASKGYDPMARDPKFARAVKCPDWELVCINSHFHPSVTAFASCLLANKPVVYTGDPLQDFKFTSFLDRFSFKKAKDKPEATAAQGRRALDAVISKAKHAHGGDGQQSGLWGVLGDMSKMMEIAAAPVGDEAAITLPETEFFMRYFNRRKEEFDQNIRKIKKKKVDDDVGDDDGEEVYDNEVDDDEVLETGDNEKMDEALREALMKEIGRDNDYGAYDGDDDDEMVGDDGEVVGDDGEAMVDDGEAMDDDDSQAMDDDDSQAMDDDDSQAMDDDDSQAMDDDDSQAMDDDDSQAMDEMSEEERPKKRPAPVAKTAKTDKKKRKDNESLYSAAEEFSHLLDTANEEHAGTSKKQLAWENRTNQRGARRQFRGRGGRRGGRRM